MDIQIIISLIIVIGMILFLVYDRKKIQIHGWFPIFYLALYKTTFGLQAMEVPAKKFPRILQIIGVIGVITGITGMIYISYEIIRTTIQLFLQPTLAPGVMLVLPIKAKGIFYVPPLYLLISLIVIVLVHEYGHGVIARARNVPILGSGFAFIALIIPIIPAAFVEPDEKKLSKREPITQLSVSAAGPFFNILLSLLIIFLLGFELPGLIPHTITEKTALYDLGGRTTEMLTLTDLTITGVTTGSPAEQGGITIGEQLTKINGVPIENKEFTTILSTLQPEQTITITTKTKEHTITTGKRQDDATRGWIGVQFEPTTGFTTETIQKYGETGSNALLSIATLFTWIILLSLGIGLFNLLPIGPLDGGRILKTILETITPNNALKIHYYISAFFFVIIVANIVAGFV